MSLSVISVRIDGWLLEAAFFATGSKSRTISSEDFLHAQPDQTQRRPLVEQHDQDRAPADERDVDVRLLALVELAGEVLLAEDLRDAARRGDVAGRQRRQRRHVELVDVARVGDRLAVAADEQHRLRVRVPSEPLRRPWSSAAAPRGTSHRGRPSRSSPVRKAHEYHSRNRVSSFVTPACVVGETAPTTLRRRRVDPDASRAAYISRRPSIARASVAWSAYSSSPPMGTPVAMRVARTPSGRSSLAR